MHLRHATGTSDGFDQLDGIFDQLVANHTNAIGATGRWGAENTAA